MSTSYSFPALAFGRVARRTVVVSSLALATSLPAQISIDSLAEVYTENFDSLPSTNTTSWSSNSTLPGWMASNGQISSTYRQGDTTLNKFSSFTVPSDRSLGGSVTGAGGQDTTRFAVRLVNNTSQVIYSADVSYYGEKWWAAGINNGFHYEGGFVVDYAINASGISGGTYLNAPSLSFDPFSGIVPDSTGNLFYSGFYDSWSLDGNHSDYRTPISGTLVFANGLGVGDELWVRWTLTNTGQANVLSDGLSIDDLTIGNFSAAPIPEPAGAAAFAGAGLLAVAALRRRRRA